MKKFTFTGREKRRQHQRERKRERPADKGENTWKKVTAGSRKKRDKQL